jgi:hypothetical protein
VSSAARFYDGTSTPWTETGLTYRNAPDFFGGEWIIPGETPAGDEVDWDLSWTQFWTTPFQTLVVSNEARNIPTIAYASRETATPPRLILDYLIIPPSQPPTETHTFTPTNDAYAGQARAKAVYGARPVLQVKNAARDVNSYVKFSVNGLTGAVRSATLRLWVNNPGPDGGAVYAVSPFYADTTTQWLETGLTWGNAPAINGAPLDSAGKVSKGQWVELDVTNAVIAALGGDGRVSLALANHSRNLVTYSSKEGAHPPELVVTMN